MKNILSIGLPICFGISLMLGSCARDNSVASNYKIQKRKYNSGYHIAFNKKKKSIQDEQIIEKQELAVSNTQTQEATKQTFAVVENEKTTDNIFQTEELTIDQPISVANESNAFTEQERSVSTMNHAFFSNQSEKSTKSNLKTLIISHKQKIKELKKSSSSDLDSILYIILCILIPFLAVGLATDWDLTKTVIALLLSIIFWIPGIIYAVIICSQEGVI